MFDARCKKLVFLLLFASQAVLAQTPIALEEALELARQNNLQLKKQQQAQMLADLQLAIQKGQRLPSLDIAAFSTYTSEIAKFDIPPMITGGRQVQVELGDHQRTDVALALRQPLYTGARLKTQVALARKALLSEEIRQEILRETVAYQVHALFYRAQILARERQTQRASLTRVQGNLDQARDLFFGAQAMAFDTLRVFTQKLQIEIEMEEIDKDLRLLEIQLARLLDLPQARPVARVDLPRPAAQPPALDSLQNMALLRRPELRAIQTAQQAAHLRGDLARSAFLPALQAELSYNAGRPGLNQVANEWMDYFAGGVRLQWNLWRGNQDRRRIEQAEVEGNRLALEERELRRQIRVEVEQAWENLRYTFRQIALADQLLAQQQERFRIVSTQHRNGVATTQDLADAETDLTQAELLRERVVVHYYLVQADLALATGTMAR